MSIMKRLSWFFKLEWRRYAIGIVALSLVSVLNLVPAKMMGEVVDRIANRSLTQTQFIMNLIALVVSAFLMYGLRFIWRQFIFGTSQLLGKILRSQLFAHFTKMSPTFYQKYRTGDLMAHATNDINALTMFAGAGIMSAVDASVAALVTLSTMLLTLSWQLTLIAVIPLPLMAFATNRLGRKNHESFREAQVAFSELNNRVQESVAGMHVTKSFGYAEAEISDFAQTNESVFQKNMTAMKYNSLFQPLILVFIGSCYVLTLVVGGHLISQGQLSIGGLVTFMTYLDMLVWPLMAAGFLFNVAQRGSVSYDRIEFLLAEQSDVVEVESPLSEIQNGKLEFNIQHFAYEDNPTLRDIHFAIEEGATLGIVGQTGSGKTTLLSLLLREYDVNEGSITLNGHNIRHYRLADLRSLIGYVPQEQILFATTIRENVRFVNPELSEERVVEATKMSGIFEDIMEMASGFDTIVGERGVSLSGGQKQRLAISRALIMEPEILIMDDSLSAVDAKTEDHIIANLKAGRKGKTTLITAHRLSAVVHADLIIVMQNGTIIERGTHEELLQQKGWYYDTYQLQQLEAGLEAERDGK